MSLAEVVAGTLSSTQARHLLEDHLKDSAVLSRASVSRRGGLWGEAS